MAAEFEVVDVWVCCFPSAEAAAAYFEETYDEGDEDDDSEEDDEEAEARSISQFAADAGERYYNHDFMERGAFHDPPIADIAAAVSPHSFSSSYLSEVVEAFRANPSAPFNCVLLVWNREIEYPVSIATPAATLHYLGRFRCNPSAPPAV
jgi:hypothetical protein